VKNYNARHDKTSNNSRLSEHESNHCSVLQTFCRGMQEELWRMLPLIIIFSASLTEVTVIYTHEMSLQF